jgi:hypothetical protein
MNALSAATLTLLALCPLAAQNLANNQSNEVLQNIYQRLLKGLPTLEVAHVKSATDIVDTYTLGKAKQDELVTQVETILKRYRIPLLAPSPTGATIKDGVGLILLSPSATRTGGADSIDVTITITLEVREKAHLKRNDLEGVSATLWKDEEATDFHLGEDVNTRLLESVSRLAQNLAVTYLAANQPPKR